jgi:hypothetical protein
MVSSSGSEYTRSCGDVGTPMDRSDRPRQLLEFTSGEPNLVSYETGL